MTIKTVLTFILLGLLFVFNSCCIGAKEDYLGNNIYLSEYDNVDRRILYQTERCAVSGVEIVPMTILELAHNDKWIIAKSGDKRNNSDFKYWIIHNSYQDVPDAETVKKNTIGPLDNNSFIKIMREKSIDIELHSIE
jgi:hypothetical protein